MMSRVGKIELDSCRDGIGMQHGRTPDVQGRYYHPSRKAGKYECLMP
jgi:hypothetical protein